MATDAPERSLSVPVAEEVAPELAETSNGVLATAAAAPPDGPVATEPPSTAEQEAGEAVKGVNEAGKEQASAAQDDEPAAAAEPATSEAETFVTATLEEAAVVDDPVAATTAVTLEETTELLETAVPVANAAEETTATEAVLPASAAEAATTAEDEGEAPGAPEAEVEVNIDVEVQVAKHLPEISEPETDVEMHDAEDSASLLVESVADDALEDVPAAVEAVVDEILNEAAVLAVEAADAQAASSELAVEQAVGSESADVTEEPVAVAEDVIVNTETVVLDAAPSIESEPVASAAPVASQPATEAEAEVGVPPVAAAEPSAEEEQEVDELSTSPIPDAEDAFPAVATTGTSESVAAAQEASLETEEVAETQVLETAKVPALAVNGEVAMDDDAQPSAEKPLPTLDVNPSSSTLAVNGSVDEAGSTNGHGNGNGEAAMAVDEAPEEQNDTDAEMETAPAVPVPMLKLPSLSTPIALPAIVAVSPPSSDEDDATRTIVWLSSTAAASGSGTASTSAAPSSGKRLVLTAVPVAEYSALPEDTRALLEDYEVYPIQATSDSRRASKKPKLDPSALVGPLSPRELVLIVNPASGARASVTTVEQQVVPLLEAFAVTATVKQTDSEDHVSVVAQELLQEAVDDRKKTLDIAVAGGDGTVSLVVGALVAALRAGDIKRPPLVRLVILPTGTANALYYNSFPPEREEYSALPSVAKAPFYSLLAYLRNEEAAIAVPLAVAMNAMTGTEDRVFTSVVTSAALHANIVSDAESLREQHPGVERFKIAAAENMPRWWNGTLKLKPIPDVGVLQYDAGEKKLQLATSQAKSSLSLRGPFSYVAAALIDRFESNLLIAPLRGAESAPLPRGPSKGKGKNATKGPILPSLDIVVVRPLQDRELAALTDADEQKQKFGTRLQEVFGKAYTGGGHIDETYASNGEPVVEYFRCQSLNWQPDASEDRKDNIVCLDGKTFDLGTKGRLDTVAIDTAALGIKLWS